MILQRIKQLHSLLDVLNTLQCKWWYLHRLTLPKYNPASRGLHIVQPEPRSILTTWIPMGNSYDIHLLYSACMPAGEVGNPETCSICLGDTSSSTVTAIRTAADAIAHCTPDSNIQSPAGLLGIEEYAVIYWLRTRLDYPGMNPFSCHIALYGVRANRICPVHGPQGMAPHSSMYISDIGIDKHPQ